MTSQDEKQTTSFVIYLASTSVWKAKAVAETFPTHLKIDQSLVPPYFGNGSVPPQPIANQDHPDSIYFCCEYRLRRLEKLLLDKRDSATVVALESGIQYDPNDNCFYETVVAMILQEGIRGIGTLPNSARIRLDPDRVLLLMQKSNYYQFTHCYGSDKTYGQVLAKDNSQIKNDKIWMGEDLRIYQLKLALIQAYKDLIRLKQEAISWSDAELGKQVYHHYKNKTFKDCEDFLDIMPALKNRSIAKRLFSALQYQIQYLGLTHIMGIATRGYYVAAHLSERLEVGDIRVDKLQHDKKPNIPGHLVEVSYGTEYSKGNILTMSSHEDVGASEDNVVAIADDGLVTGGTASAAEILAMSGRAEVPIFIFLFAFPDPQFPFHKSYTAAMKLDGSWKLPTWELNTPRPILLASRVSLQLLLKPKYYLNSENAVIACGRADPWFAQKVASLLGCSLLPINIKNFANHELLPEIHSSVRNKDVFFLNPQCDSANGQHSVHEICMETDFTLAALSDGSARRVIHIATFLAYVRQDKKAGREPISSKVRARAMEAAGMTKLVTVDLHSSQTQGFYKHSPDNLYAEKYLLSAMQELMMKKDEDHKTVVVVSPDAGGAKRAERVAQLLSTKDRVVHYVVCGKTRPKANEVDNIMVTGDVKNALCLLVDDMADTCGTLCKAAEALAVAGATETHAFVVHGVFSGSALDKIKQCKYLSSVTCTNTMPQVANQMKCLQKLRVLDVTEMIAEVIYRIHSGMSVSDMFGPEKKTSCSFQPFLTV